MYAENQPIDISDWPELARVVEVARRTGTDVRLVRGGEEVAVITPIGFEESDAADRSAAADDEPDSLLNIIGIADMGEPTDIARYKDAYLAEAYLPTPE